MFEAREGFHGLLVEVPGVSYQGILRRLHARDYVADLSCAEPPSGVGLRYQQPHLQITWMGFDSQGSGQYCFVTHVEDLPELPVLSKLSYDGAFLLGPVLLPCVCLIGRATQGLHGGE